MLCALAQEKLAIFLCELQQANELNRLLQIRFTRSFLWLLGHPFPVDSNNYIIEGMFLKIFVVLACIAVSLADALNNSPIVGIFTQPTDSTEGDCGGDCLYLAASYVKYIESSGARVVPINFHATEAELDKLLPSLNGVFFPGGDAEFPPAAQYTFDKVKQMNDAGEHFPLWGTCMGFEWLLMSATRDSTILDPKNGQMDAYNLSIPLDFTATYKNSALFKNAPSFITNVLAKQNVTMNNHHYGIWTEHFFQTPVLTDFFHVLSNNKDRNGDEFVSMIEAHKYPIFGSQWHPEKNNFE